MHKILSKWFIIIIFLLTACKDDGDSSPPAINIIEPSSYSIVSEIATIKCNVTDNDSVRFVELWVDSIATGIIDSIAPFELLWNTVPYQDSTEHTIIVVAEDMSGNVAYSKPCILIVDNSSSMPQSLNIISINYTKTEMTIVIEGSKDDDFESYSILNSQSINSTKILKAEIFNIADTVIQINQFNPVDSSWYWVQIEDIHGYSSTGNGYFVMDESPNASSLNSVEFLDSLFSISWSVNNEDDFQSYSLFESSFSNMSNAVNIFETNDRNITAFSHRQINQNEYKYYKVVVQDYWDLQAESNIESGCSWFLFNNTYMDASYDFGRSLLQTMDDGYILVGSTSFLGDEYSNILLVRLNHKGEEEWIKNHSFSATDNLNAIKQLPDGGFIMVGSTISSTNSSKDILLVKSDALGNIIWHQSYGGNQDEVGHSIDISDNGTFIISGQKADQSSGYNLSYLLKVDEVGDLIWSKTFGGSYNDYGYSVINTDNGGYILSGSTRSLGDINGDAWAIKMDSDGTILWENTYGGNGSESIRSIKQTIDGGYIMVGHTDSFGNGYNDVYLLKINSQGDIQWYKTYGGMGTDNGWSVVETLDPDGYIIFGYSDSYGQSGSYDYWMIKTDVLGNVEWDQTFGGERDDKAFCGLQATDGGYLIGGYSRSNSSNLPNILLVKTDDQGNTK